MSREGMVLRHANGKVEDQTVQMSNTICIFDIQSLERLNHNQVTFKVRANPALKT